jgi:heavy metal sensor kinase
MRVRHVLQRFMVNVRTIRVRLTFWYMALLALILVGFSAFLYVSLSRSLRGEADHILASDAQQVSSSLDIQNGQPQIGESPPTGSVVALYTTSGQLLAASDARTPVPPLLSALHGMTPGQRAYTTVRLTGNEEWRVVTEPVVQNGHVVGILEVARSERDVQTTLSQLLTLTAIAVPLTLMVAVGGGLFLAQRALGPIDRITRTVQNIGADDLSHRLRLPARPDEVGRLAATFDGMLDRLDRAFQRERRFTADASHELRTPLAMLISQVDVALQRPRRVAEYRQTLTSVRGDATRMNRLVNELLTLARGDAGQEVLACETLALDALAGDVVESMASLAETRGVRLERPAGEPVTVEGDQTRLTQLVVNLVDNALKHTPAGGIVTVTVDRVTGWAVLRVTDTGAGIAAEHLSHIFERFYRVDPARTRADGSTGLGLSIAQWIVQAHGGVIGVASTLGKGTTITVRLPLASRPEGR